VTYDYSVQFLFRNFIYASDLTELTSFLKRSVSYFGQEDTEMEKSGQFRYSFIFLIILHHFLTLLSLIETSWSRFS